MAFNNRNNLSNESAPWGREVEQKIETNAYDLNQLRLLTENNNKATNGTLSALTRQQQTLTEQQALLEAQQKTTAELTSATSVGTYSGNFIDVVVGGDFGYRTVTLGSFSVSSPPGDSLLRFCSINTSASATVTNYAGNFSQNVNLDLYLTVQGYGNIEAAVQNIARFPTDTSSSTAYTITTQGVYGFTRRKTQNLRGLPPENVLVLKADVLRPMSGGTFTISGQYEIAVETYPSASTETITPI